MSAQRHSPATAAQKAAPPPARPTLPVWAQAVVELFMEIAQFLGLPRTVGQIFGLIFSSDKPLSLDDIAEGLQISRASVSTGLTYLRRFDAVRLSFVPGDRREYYQAETNFSRVAQGFMSDQVDPDLAAWGERLRFGRQMLKLADAASGTNPGHSQERLEVLAQWHREITALAALVRAHIARPDSEEKP